MRFVYVWGEEKARQEKQNKILVFQVCMQK